MTNERSKPALLGEAAMQQSHVPLMEEFNQYLQTLVDTKMTTLTSRPFPDSALIALASGKVRPRCNPEIVNVQGTPTKLPLETYAYYSDYTSAPKQDEQPKKVDSACTYASGAEGNLYGKLTAASVVPNSFNITFTNGDTVKIQGDGKVEHTGTAYDAAKIFWQAIERTFVTENTSLKHQVDEAKETIDQLRTIIGAKDGESVIFAARRTLDQLELLSERVAALTIRETTAQTLQQPTDDAPRSLGEALSFAKMKEIKVR